MQTLARSALVLVIILMVLSAYLRLDHSGIGCEPWPACYGNIGVVQDSPDAATTYERLLEEAQQPLSWATPLHRLVASVLGLLILAMTLLALRQHTNRIIAFSLLGLTVFLAWLGIYSEGLHSPAVVMGNLCGGFAMLGLLGWLVCKKPGSDLPRYQKLRLASAVAVAVLCLQIILGGLTSANFAASACQTLPDCHGSWLPGRGLATAFDLSRTHETGVSGLVLGGAERAAIHQLHRLVALLTVAAVAIAAYVAMRAGGDLFYVGLGAMILVCTELALGAAAILSGLPIGIAVAHNWIAALLLLALLKLYSESTAGSA
jgi:cytochrome c oxidase assembly protein subunit 15